MASNGWVPLSSSWMSAALWNEQDGLSIRLKDGEQLNYPAASEAQFNALITASSPGQFYHQVLKNGGQRPH
jgi:hypothetical protein